MTASEQTSPARSGNWLANQPYLLLSITALCWAGNAIVGRLAAGQIAPVPLSFLRWSFSFLTILPFAWKHLVRDWAAIRSRLGIMILLSITGIGAFNTLQYWALEHTEALNTLLLQSAGPLLVAVWSLILLGDRLTLAQAAGITLSLAGVLVILLRGDVTGLASIEFNKGDRICTLSHHHRRPNKRSLRHGRQDLKHDCPAIDGAARPDRRAPRRASLSIARRLRTDSPASVAEIPLRLYRGSYRERCGAARQ